MPFVRVNKWINKCCKIDPLLDSVTPASCLRFVILLSNWGGLTADFVSFQELPDGEPVALSSYVVNQKKHAIPLSVDFVGIAGG